MADTPRKPAPLPAALPAAPPGAEIDYSMMAVEQVIHLCLQRSNRIKRLVPSLKRTPTGWDALMRQTATENRDTILAEVSREVGDMFAKIAPIIARFAPRSVADLGCGQAFIDLLIYRTFGCDLVLIDIEQSEGLHFGFKAEGAGYADLANARAFLVANGVPDRAITTINPKHQPLADLAPVDLAISLISCGFHYPVATYDSFFQTQVRKAILLDARNGTDAAATLARYGAVESAGHEKKHERLLCVKPEAKAVAKTAPKTVPKTATKTAPKSAPKTATKTAPRAPASKAPTKGSGSKTKRP